MKVTLTFTDQPGNKVTIEGEMDGLPNPATAEELDSQRATLNNSVAFRLALHAKRYALDLLAEHLLDNNGRLNDQMKF
jgi:hypothetical protein